jgi:hypothetical protein
VSTPKRFPNQSFTGGARRPAADGGGIPLPHSRGVCGSIAAGWTASAS